MGYGSTVHDLMDTDNVFEDVFECKVEEDEYGNEVLIPESPSTIISQYAHAERVTKLAKYIHKHLDQEDVFESLFSKVFDVETAEGIFLDHWGAIVGVKRTTIVDGVTYKLSDEIFRELIMFRTAMNVSEATIVRINELLTDLFNMPIAVGDDGDMTMRIFVERGLPNTLLVMLKFYGYTMKPAGVGYEFVMTDPNHFGFFGQRLRNFNHGVFNTNPLQ